MLILGFSVFNIWINRRFAFKHESFVMTKTVYADYLAFNKSARGGYFYHHTKHTLYFDFKSILEYCNMILSNCFVETL